MGVGAPDVVVDSLDGVMVVLVGLQGMGVGAPAVVAGSLDGVMVVPVGLQEMGVGAPAVVAGSLVAVMDVPICTEFRGGKRAGDVRDGGVVAEYMPLVDVPVYQEFLALVASGAASIPAQLAVAVRRWIW
ncbi:unnamed protein product [Gongylonema pulchrum]|uniref:Secreted protein n=1 Tax=Gongylonema pulchrum TaxID=637853 RepID=A0A183DGJ3_9BILA|nr:unnamed protein product [Gongylonema pulchrum]